MNDAYSILFEINVILAEEYTKKHATMKFIEHLNNWRME